MDHIVSNYSANQARFYAMASPEKQQRLFDRHQTLRAAVSADVSELVTAMGDYDSILQTLVVKRRRRKKGLVAMTAGVLVAVAGAALLPVSWSPLMAVLMLLTTGAAGVFFAFNWNHAVRADETDAARRIAVELFDEYAVVLHSISQHGTQARLAGQWLGETNGHAKKGHLNPALHRAQALLDTWVSEDAEQAAESGEDRGAQLPPYAAGPR